MGRYKFSCMVDPRDVMQAQPVGDLLIRSRKRQAKLIVMGACVQVVAACTAVTAVCSASSWPLRIDVAVLTALHAGVLFQP